MDFAIIGIAYLIGVALFVGVFGWNAWRKRTELVADNAFLAGSTFKAVSITAAVVVGLAVCWPVTGTIAVIKG